ncbi:MAG: hypothetical protein NXI32_24100 [bacterium]|nr:hypothetical protein [bacterium]
MAKKLSANNWRTFADRRSYYRANTVAIPATDMMPELVILQLCNAPFRPKGENDALSITSIHEDWTTERIIALEDVRAIFIPSDPEKPEESFNDPDCWAFGDELTSLLSQAKSANKDATRGQVYVLREAAVLMNVSFGVSAAQSAAFFPGFLYGWQEAYGECKTPGECRSVGEC